MNNDVPILTICIPTYNRGKELSENLMALCPLLNNEVRVIVRDNCSNGYDVRTVTKPFEDRYGIRVIQNKVNVGMNANIAKAFEECETEWLWVLGDDDCVSSDGVKIVLKAIHDNPDAVYIKFNSETSKRTKGIVEFSNVLTSLNDFTTSFFISETIHNVSKTNSYTYWHYEYLSSMIGQILRVIRFLIDNPDAICVFTKDKILLEHGENISWSRTDLVYAYQYVFDVFRGHRSVLNNNFFKGIAGFSFSYIRHSQLKTSEKIHYLNLVVYKYGFINTIRYLGKTYMGLWVSIMFGNGVYKYVKKSFKKI